MMTFGVVVDLLDRDFTRSGFVTSAAVVATPGTVFWVAFSLYLVTFYVYRCWCVVLSISLNS